MASSPITPWQINRETMETVTDFIFLASKSTADSDCSHEIKRWLASWKKRYEKARQHIKKQRYHFANNGLYSQSYGFCSSHVHMWELDHKVNWEPKNCCFQTVILEKTLDSASDSKKIKSVNPKINQPWIFIGETYAEAEAPILWPPDRKSWVTGKDPDAGKDWGQEETWSTVDELLEWHHWLNGYELERVKDREACYATVHGVTRSQTGLVIKQQVSKIF